MSNYDVFQEVDEEVRREQLQKLWERYQYYVIAAVTLLILGVAAWRGYDWYVTKQAAETGAAFEEAMLLSERGEHADAEGAFARIAAQGTAVGPHDLIIAATAIAKGYAVATRDERSFPKIGGLNLLRW